MSRPQLYLIDANAFCYRAYYALKGLATSYGQPTNAIFGFINFLNKILKQNKPEYLGVCFDVSRDTFRQRKFPEYKMQRPPMPEGLITQIPVIKQIIQAYGIVLYEKAGFEADDLIASLVKKARQNDLDVTIISPDKDILQLVNEHTVVFSPYKDKGTIYDSEGVQGRFAIKPSQMIDFISLAGDAADNIPPVKGIGEKTAIRLIQDFDSIDGILANLEKIKPQRLQQALRENIEKISLNRSIVKLKEDIKLEFDLDKLKLKDPDNSALYKIFRQLEFRSLLRALSCEDNPARIAISTQGEGFAAGMNRVKGLCEFRDIKELILIYGNEQLAFFAVKEKIFAELGDGDFTDQARDILNNPKIKKIGHNLKELKIRLARRKARLEGLYFDT
ncbi:MAG: hypothetical protein ISS44_04650, partial [Candidatus Omnitrophica bacterium]|nr:hypothetical protein [Candidatus Omnitrophota bacterium]